MKEKLDIFWGKTRTPAIFLFTIVGLFGFIILPNRNQFKTSFSPFETAESLRIETANDLINNVTFLPERGLQYLVYSHSNEIMYLRLFSVIFAVSTLLMFYYILRHWYTTRVAVLGTFLFGTSSWFLHQARTAEPDIMYMFSVTALIYCGVLLSEKTMKNALPVVAGLVAVTLYVPGVWILVALGAVFARNEIIEKWRYSANWLKALSVAIFSAILAPMVYGLFNAPNQITTIMGVPADGVLSAKYALTNFLNIVPQIFIRGIDEPLKWLVGTPILDIFTIVMVGLGIYTYKAGPHPVRGKALALITLTGLVLIVLSGSVVYGMLMPVLYIFAASGVGLLLQQWFSVFPKNPIAKNIAVGWICFALVIVGYYHTNRYFVVWPQAATTSKLISN